MYRLHPLWQRVRELVDDGAIGELRAIQAFFSYRNVDPDNIRNIAEYGGGALMDIGCYPINVARWMFDGEPTDVVGRRAPRPAVRHRRPDVGRARLRRPPRHVHVLDAARGRPAGPPASAPPGGCWSRSRSTSRPIGRRGSSGPPAATRRWRPDIEVIEVPPADPYAVQGDAFSAAVRDGSPVPIPPTDAIGNMAVIERILAAAG